MRLSTKVPPSGATHELAHEDMWDERLKAMKEKDGKLMRECELLRCGGGFYVERDRQ